MSQRDWSPRNKRHWMDRWSQQFDHDKNTRVPNVDRNRNRSTSGGDQKSRDYIDTRERSRSRDRASTVVSSMFSCLFEVSVMGILRSCNFTQTGKKDFFRFFPIKWNHTSVCNLLGGIVMDFMKTTKIFWCTTKFYGMT